MSAAKRNALGKGLGALIEDAGNAKKEVVNNPAINEIEINFIEANPFQPRKEFDEDALNELAQSIKQIGIIQPITVRKINDEKYQLISGERRFRASQLAGLTQIPAYVRTADDQGMLEMALVENIQREDLDAIEIAMSYQQLIDECNLTQEDMSERVGKKRSTVTNYLRLLKLPAEIQLGIKRKFISMGHARALVNIEDSNDQLFIFEQIINNGLSVRKTEELVRNLKEQENKTPTPNTEKKEDKNSDYKELAEQLSGYFNSKVEFKVGSKGKGKIVIPFASDEELERIISILDKSKS